jgi:hypothetical protein
MYCIREKDFDETKHRMWSGDTILEDQEEDEYLLESKGSSSQRTPSEAQQLQNSKIKYHYYSPPKQSENSPTIDNVKALMIELRHQHLTKGQIFHFMDEYRNDRVTLREFKRGLEHIGITTTHREALRMFHKIDTNRDGRISWREFEDAYMSSVQEGDNHPGTGNTRKSRSSSSSSIDDRTSPEILRAAIPQGAVRYHESSDKWVTYYNVDGTDQFVGIYPNEYEAQVAYVEHERIQSTKEQILTTPTTTTNGSTAAAATRKSDIDTYFSNLVHEKILLGWIPLQEEYCEPLDGVRHANVPLLLDHSGRKWSAVQNGYVEDGNQKNKDNNKNDHHDKEEIEMIRRLSETDLYREMDRSRNRLLASNVPEECIAWARRIRHIASALHE